MKASDLMIRDWVVYDGDIEYINQIRVEGMDVATGSLITSDREDVGFDGISPIPLTQKTLENSGFVKYIAGQYVLSKMAGEIFVSIMPMEGLPNANGKWLVAIKNGYTDVRIPITYIHELQHVLKLCKIKKEIVL